jgi:hypothetical protein
LENKPGSDNDIIARQITAFLDETTRVDTLETALKRHREPVTEPDSGGFTRTPSIAVTQPDATNLAAPLLVVPGQILVDDEHAASAKEQLGPEFVGPETVACSKDVSLPIVRFRGPSDAVMAATDRLYDVGIPANFSYVTPSGPFIKSSEGAEFPRGELPKLDSKTRHEIGEGCIRVAIIDTGLNIDDTHWGSSWLQGVTQDRTNRDPLNAISGGPLDNGGGHGTFVAGVVRQVAPAARVKVYRALDSDGFGSEEAVACAILRAAHEGVDIINLSLGTESYKDRPPVALNAALNLLPDEIVVVAAAGNDGSSRPNWPGAFKRVVAVGGLDRDLKPTKWSNRGNWIDFSTVGEGIVSTFVVGFEVEERDPKPEDWRPGPTPWGMWTGTSFAAPQITGLIAREAESSDAQDALAKLRSQGTHMADWGIAVASPLGYTLA